ncbi:hypothetical protein HHI36_014761 [Cryptolaemus montrouzieri]|uniref:Uncharacterized protein n=1 Tax=Cryptolaemus montrouzieri TaxID=559131 RepID=A0ABD2N3T7_9CUCU
MMQGERIEELQNKLRNVNWNIIYKTAEEDINGQWESFMKLFSREFNIAYPLKCTHKNQKKKHNIPAAPSTKLKSCKSRLDILHLCKLENPVFSKAYN